MPAPLRRRTRLPVHRDEHGHLATSAQVRYLSPARRTLTATLFVGRRVRVVREYRDEREVIVGRVEAITHVRFARELLIREKGCPTRPLSLAQVASIEELGE